MIRAVLLRVGGPSYLDPSSLVTGNVLGECVRYGRGGDSVIQPSSSDDWAEYGHVVRVILAGLVHAGGHEPVEGVGLQIEYGGVAR